jgi:polyhydroxybutyrate depolymerase
LAARAGVTIPADLQPGTIEVGGQARTYLLACPSVRRPPLLLVLHGGGGNGAGIAGLTQLHERAPAAGFSAVFPDGLGRAWNDGRLGPALRRRNGDDVGFLNQLIERLVAEDLADRDAVFAVGMSNGGFMSEHLGRHALAPLAGLVLVATSANGRARQAVPIPKRPAMFMAFCGTADPIVPYAGGPVSLFGRGSRADRRGARGEAAPIEAVAADWVAANGLQPTPIIDHLSVAEGDLPVTRLSWQQAGRPSVVLHRVEGGGHTWPGGAQYLPSRLVGPRSTSLDATGVLLAWIAAALGGA